MKFHRASLYAVASSAFLLAACTDMPGPNEPSARDTSPSAERSAVAQDRLAALFPETSRDILALPGTIYADHDEARGKLVFGVESESAIPGITRSLEARGLAAGEFEVVRTEPIRMMATLRDVFRPTIGGIQIHFGGYLCTLGFNVTHNTGARSFITNSHCTNTQGGVEGTNYYQPTSTLSGGVIATEVADPAYVSGGVCSAGKVCRRSDASRALYASGTASSQGVIAKTTGMNVANQITTASNNFIVTSQDNSNTSFSGTIHKVGRTTGWTSGTVTGTCVNVNVSGSNIQQLCQTLVTNNSAAIVGSGDSGSPAFKITSGDNVTLVGILWGGGGSTQFVFSPLKNIQDELGGVTATNDGSGGGGGGGGTEPPPPTCVPIGKSGKCR